MKYTLEDMQKIMTEQGMAVRAIPTTVRVIVEECNADKYPGGELRYLSEFKRKMWVVEETAGNAGKLIAETGCGTLKTVRFNADAYYDTLEELLDAATEKNGQTEDTTGDSRNFGKKALSDMGNGIDMFAQKLGETVYDTIATSDNYFTSDIGRELYYVLEDCNTEAEYKAAVAAVHAICGCSIGNIVETIMSRDAENYEWESFC